MYQLAPDFIFHHLTPSFFCCGLFQPYISSKWANFSRQTLLALLLTTEFLF
jgi:hypothetical protein